MAKAPSLTFLPWQADTPSPIARFPGLIRAEAYAAIHRFLTTERLVRQALDRVAAANAGAGFAAFRQWMATEEARLGFSPEIVTIETGDRLVKASQFWLWLFHRKPLNDLGAGEFHGASTHRLQWLLIGLWNDATGALGSPRAVAELYAGLAHGNARLLKAEWVTKLAQNLPSAVIDTGRDNPFHSVWDGIIDGPHVANATSPEYLCANFLATQYPALHPLVRG
jgi:hypothetical protein